LRAVINPSWDFDQNTALTLLPACASALGAGFSDNSALTVALTAGGGCSEATKDTLLDSPYLAGAITVGASAGLTTWFTANTLAQGAVLGARYTYLLFTTKGGLFKGDSKLVAEVSTAPWSLAGGRGCSPEEGFKDVTKATEIKPFKTSPEEPLSTAMPKAVIGSALVRVSEYLVGLVYLLKPVRSPILAVVVRVILKG